MAWMVSLSELFSKFLQARTMGPDPREETPCQAKRRLHHLECKADAVRAKIERAYALDPVSVPSDTQIEDAANNMAAKLIDYARPQHILHQNRLPRAELQQTMARGMRDYLTIFRTYRDLKATPAVHAGYERYDSAQARDSLLHIYANHLTNATEARFIAQRVDAFDAHLLNGLLIRSTLDLATKTIDKDVHLDPAQLRPANDLEKHQQIDQLRNYWRNRVLELKGALEANDHYRQ